MLCLLILGQGLEKIKVWLEMPILVAKNTSEDAESILKTHLILLQQTRMETDPSSNVETQTWTMVNGLAAFLSVTTQSSPRLPGMKVGSKTCNVNVVYM